MERGGSGKRRRMRMVAVTAVVVALLYLWVAMCERRAHIVPKVQRISIQEVLEEEDWGEEVYAVLEQQTGLAESVLKILKEQGRRDELIALQAAYFAPVRISCIANSILTREEYLVNAEGRIVKGMPIPVVENGDILITNCSHALGWRNGHAAIVVDAGRRQVLEAQVLGMPTVRVSLAHWESYPSFLVLRLKGVSEEQREAIAEYAAEALTGIPYRLSAGLWPTEEITGTQCAHLVWYVYQQFGYDLDSDGGRIVTPRDLAESELLEVVQHYGTG